MKLMVGALEDGLIDNLDFGIKFDQDEGISQVFRGF